jgi:thiosulfate/3-mercaptopyruvate sulfurtransferase
MVRAMAFLTLVDTDALSHHLAGAAFAIVDCRFRLDDERWGERAYVSGHIPGAVYAHLDRDLSGPKTGANGRHPLPQASALGRCFERLGVGDGTQVVAYDQDTGMYASRLWWLLRWMGHREVAVLDGGFARWVAEGRPTVAGIAPQESRAGGTFTAAPRAEMTMSADQVARVRQHSDWKVVDARAPERYRGEVEPIDRVPGHIPGATNHYYMENLDAQGTFLPTEVLRERLHQAIGVVASDRVVCYCGSGVTACHNLLALEHAGMPGARLYPGSWSEWSSDPARPVQVGDT